MNPTIQNSKPSALADELRTARFAGVEKAFLKAIKKTRKNEMNLTKQHVEFVRASRKKQGRKLDLKRIVRKAK